MAQELEEAGICMSLEHRVLAATYRAGYQERKHMSETVPEDLWNNLDLATFRTMDIQSAILCWRMLRNYVDLILVRGTPLTTIHNIPTFTPYNATKRQPAGGQHD